MIRRTFARLTVSSIAALTLAACQDGEAPLAPDIRAFTPRFTQSPTEQLDQSNVVSNNASGSAANNMGQWFTAGRSGLLTSIEVQITCGLSMSDGTMNVYAGAYDERSIAIPAPIASQPVASSIWPSCDPMPTTPITMRVAFDTPASVVAGQVYTFRLMYSGFANYPSNSSNAYAAGTMWGLRGPFDLLFKTYVLDLTPPVITPTVTGLSVNGWYVGNVNVSWAVTDGESAITESSGCGSMLLEDETNGTTYTCSATSGGGSAEQSVTIKIDKSGPTLSPTVSPNPVVLNGTATVSPNVSVEGLGLASVTCGDVITSSVGQTTVVCTASDLAGRGSAIHALYTVIYPFTGFFAPVDAAPVQNVTKAGSAVPVKFSLGGNRGLAIMAADYPASQTMSCGTSAPTADLEETVTAGNSSLTYDAGANRYTYVWKTDKSWAGSCRKLTVKLIDGSEHTAYFKFAK